jgi:hypothetical protein
MRPDWRFLALLTTLFAVWAFFALAPGCVASRPTELSPAERTSP